MRAREPDAPAVELRRAAWWRRLVAGVIDACVVLAFVVPAVWLRVLARRRGALVAEPGGAEERSVRAMRLLGSLVALLRRLGESPGFRVAGLEVRDRVSGRRPAFGRTLLRAAIDELPTRVMRWATAGARERQRLQRASPREAVSGESLAFPGRLFAEQLLVGLLVRVIAAPLRRRLDARVVTVSRGQSAAPRGGLPRTRRIPATPRSPACAGGAGRSR
jgi:hypothetical protein